MMSAELQYHMRYCGIACDIALQAEHDDRTRYACGGCDQGQVVSTSERRLADIEDRIQQRRGIRAKVQQGVGLHHLQAVPAKRLGDMAVG